MGKSVRSRLDERVSVFAFPNLGVQRRPAPQRRPSRHSSWRPNTQQNIYSIPKFNNFLVFPFRQETRGCQFQLVFVGRHYGAARLVVCARPFSGGGTRCVACITLTRKRHYSWAKLTKTHYTQAEDTFSVLCLFNATDNVNV